MDTTNFGQGNDPSGRQSRRSATMRFPPASYEACSPARHIVSKFSRIPPWPPAPVRSWLKRIGPLPTLSLICLNGSLSAIRAGVMKQHCVPILPSTGPQNRAKHRASQVEARGSPTVRTSIFLDGAAAGEDLRRHALVELPEHRHYGLRRHPLRACG